VAGKPRDDPDHEPADGDDRPMVPDDPAEDRGDGLDSDTEDRRVDLDDPEQFTPPIDDADRDPAIRERRPDD
jgi:hypothetical protein